MVAPAWVDVHTHFDGQVTWGDALDPSFSNGVTTVIMGNCGVGFAPCPPGGEHTLIELMESVEDIPGTALYEGVPWGAWSTFPEYLDFRGVRNEDATVDDLADMRRLVREAAEGGAFGLSTSRTVDHRSLDRSQVPGTYAAPEELIALAQGMMDGGGGVFEAITASSAGAMRALGGERFTQDEELALLATIARTTGAPATFTTVQNVDYPDAWREVLDFGAEQRRAGVPLFPQVGSRPTSIFVSLGGDEPRRAVGLRLCRRHRSRGKRLPIEFVVEKQTPTFPQVVGVPPADQRLLGHDRRRSADPGK